MTIACKIDVLTYYAISRLSRNRDGFYSFIIYNYSQNNLRIHRQIVSQFSNNYDLTVAQCKM